ncbi:hypothetical protein [Xanthobacter sp. VNH20]|uniref:hypothetical protein n=1 Tax=Xanthobacter sp. VNH20 TaxID=3156616 RepID=UPI0032B41C52
MSGSGSARSTVAGWALRLALAYALLLQMVFASAAAAQHAATAPDPWSAMCAGLASTHSDSPAEAPHINLCCVVGCLASPAPLAMPGGEAARLEPAPRVTAILFAERPAAGPARHNSRPFHARGPPCAV